MIGPPTQRKFQCHATPSHAGLCPLCDSYDVAYYLRSPPAGDVFVKVHRVDDQETRSLGRVLTLDNIHVRRICYHSPA